ncbi:LysR family transcriptional regulator [Asanoa hainanensis]|nr:LysR family transcriptional regulator [Asanoa hainanensis]
MDRLETRELGYFVAVAQELHFGHAAERLGISPPPLSRAITRLERRVGAPLFDRTSRSVALTAAGEAFLAESLKALDAVDNAVVQARRAHRSGRLRIATHPGTGSGLLRELITRTTPDHPVDLVFTRDQAAVLRARDADIGLLCATTDLHGLDSVEVGVERPFALLPSGHRLADRPAVELSELDKEPNYQAEAPVTALDELVDLVSLDQLVVVVGESAARRAGDGVIAVPVADLPDTVLLLAWPSGPPSPQASALLRAARSGPAVIHADLGVMSVSES